MNSSNGEFSLDGLEVPEAIAATKRYIAEKGLGRVKVNYRLRDAIFSRQRYWGEPFPVYYKDGIPHLMPESALPLLLPEVDKYLPTETGEPPLGRAKNWVTSEGYPIELNTMPGFAGSSAYYLRYMDPDNNEALVSREADEYWRNVDLYIGGTEHATGHLIYSRFWNKFLYDLGHVVEPEPFKKLINQGMIRAAQALSTASKTPIHLCLSALRTSMTPPRSAWMSTASATMCSISKPSAHGVRSSRMPNSYLKTENTSAAGL